MREHRTRVSPVVLLVYFTRIDRVVFEHWSALGSLIDPGRDARIFVDRDLDRDPPEFREFVVAEYLRWCRCRGRAHTRHFGVAAVFTWYHPVGPDVTEEAAIDFLAGECGEALPASAEPTDALTEAAR